MYTLITVIHLVISLLLIGIVLFQADEGAGLGGAFGTGMSGGGGSMFGKKGAAGVVTRFTAILVTVFLITSFILTYMKRDEVAGPSRAFGSAVQQPVQAPPSNSN